MTLEIERKFLVKTIPADLDLSNKTQIFQSYLAIGKEEVRIRYINRKYQQSYQQSYFLTCKKGRGLKREEVEIEISEESYNQIQTATNIFPLLKIRYKIPYGELIIELDKYQQFDLIIAEIELLNKDCKIIIPDWFGREVTGEKRYSNQFLWKCLQSY